MTERVSADQIVHWLTARMPKSGVLGGAVGCVVSVLLLAPSGCASLSCRPALITVARKEERARLETTPRAFTGETGRLEERRQPEVVRDYWVQDHEGAWHRVSLEKYRAAVLGQALEVCR